MALSHPASHHVEKLIGGNVERKKTDPAIPPPPRTPIAVKASKRMVNELMLVEKGNKLRWG